MVAALRAPEVMTGSPEKTQAARLSAASSARAAASACLSCGHPSAGGVTHRSRWWIAHATHSRHSRSPSADHRGCRPVKSKCWWEAANAHPLLPGTYRLHLDHARLKAWQGPKKV